MAQAVHAALVRLREADAVRLCGLDAAARGLELASHAAVRNARQLGARLEAVVEDERACAVWIESNGDAPAARLRWGCGCHADQPHDGEVTLPALGLGCAHVAAVLTAWIRAPADFIAPAEPAMPGGKEPGGEAAPPPRARVSQPALLRPGRSATGGRAGLAEELARLSDHDLAGLARRVLGRESADAETRAQLAAALGDPHLVATLLGRLETGARALLADILLMSGAVTAADLDGLASRSGRPASALRTEAAVLERHGLLFPASGSAGATSGRAAAGQSSQSGQSGHSWREVAGWRVPPEVRAALPLALPLVPLAAEGSGPPPLPSDDGARSPAGARPRYARLIRASPRQLCLALVLLALAPRPFNPFDVVDPALTRQPRPRASALVGAPFPLAPGDLPDATLAELARAAGLPTALVALARRILLWARAAGAAAALAAIPYAPRAEAGFALRTAFRLWRDAESAAELADLPLMEVGLRAVFDPEHAALRPAALAAEVAAARAEIVRLVALARPGVWYPLAGFLDLLWHVHPHYLRGRQQAYARPAWWLERSGEPPRPLRAEVRDEWMAADGAFARGLLAGALHWWGALDLAAGPDGSPVAFRLTQIGRFLLGDDTDAPEGEPRAALAGEWGAPVLVTREGSLAVQPMAATPGLLDALAVWARPTAIASGRLVYTLAPDLACAALDGGIAPDALLERLRNADGGRAAEAVAPRLRRWQAEYGKTRIESGWALLEAESEAALAEALAYVPALAAHCRRIAPALALVPVGEAAALAAALGRRGYHL
jgi:hypothetical protein